METRRNFRLSAKGGGIEDFGLLISDCGFIDRDKAKWRNGDMEKFRLPAK